jgi:hypothetical protein
MKKTGMKVGFFFKFKVTGGTENANPAIEFRKFPPYGFHIKGKLLQTYRKAQFLLHRWR